MTEGLRLEVVDRVATVTLDRPAKKNPLTFELYAALRDWFRAVGDEPGIRAIVLTGAGGNFCSGGDVHEIIGPLVGRSMPELLEFTRMTGALVEGDAQLSAADRRRRRRRLRRRRRDPRDGVRHPPGDARREDGVPVHARRAGRLRHGRLRDPAAHHRPGPRRRAAPAPGARWARRRPSAAASTAGSWPPEDLLGEAQSVASSLAHGPTFAHAMTKTMLQQEWAMGVGEAIEAEAQAQAICMQTHDFERAYRAFAARERPVFEGD